MSLEECAAIAVPWWGPEAAPTMVAIAGAESGWNPAAEGDHLSIFNPAQQLAYQPFACNGNLSVGYWQIFLGVHSPLVRNMSGLWHPCELAGWLHDGNNNARAAAAIRVNAGGYKPWSVFNDGSYAAFLPQAEEACRKFLESHPPNPEPPAQQKPFDYARLGQMFRALGDAIESMGRES